MNVAVLRQLVEDVTFHAAEDKGVSHCSMLWKALRELRSYIREIETEEDAEDVAAAREAMAEPGSVPLETVVGELRQYDASPSLASVLVAAAAVGYSVTFRLEGNE